MTILPPITNTLLGYTATFICIGFGMLFLQQVAKKEVGPGYWAAGFFLNSVGFLFWAGRVIFSNPFYFIAGDFIHMIGFITLVYGAYRFAERVLQKWQVFALAGLGALWLAAVCSLRYYLAFSFFLLMVLRATLFLWAGHMVLTCVPARLVTGRRLTGWSLIAWGGYVLLFPFISRTPELMPFAVGLLVGFHVMAGMGMVIMVVDKIRIRAEDSETQIKRLEGLIPICSKCKKIRDDKDYWHNLETYIQKHSDAKFSHGICPDCSDLLYGSEDWYVKSKKA